MEGKLLKKFKEVTITGRGKNVDIRFSKPIMYNPKKTLYSELTTNMLYMLCNYLCQEGDKLLDGERSMLTTNLNSFNSLSNEMIYSRKNENITEISENGMDCTFFACRSFQKWCDAMLIPNCMNGLEFDDAKKLGINMGLNNIDLNDLSNRNELTISDVICFNADLRSFKQARMKMVLKQLKKSIDAEIESVFVGITLESLQKNEIIKFIPKYREDIEKMGSKIKKKIDSKFVHANKVFLGKKETEKLKELEHKLITKYENRKNVNGSNVYKLEEYKDEVYELEYYSAWSEYKITVNLKKLKKLQKELKQIANIDVSCDGLQQEELMQMLYINAYYRRLKNLDKRYKNVFKDVNNMSVDTIEKDKLLSFECKQALKMLYFRAYEGKTLGYYHKYKKTLQEYNLEKDKEDERWKVVYNYFIYNIMDDIPSTVKLEYKSKIIRKLNRFRIGRASYKAASVFYTLLLVRCIIKKELPSLKFPYLYYDIDNWLDYSLSIIEQNIDLINNNIIEREISMEMYYLYSIKKKIHLAMEQQSDNEYKAS